MWLEEPREERERRVCEPLKDTGRVVALDAEREDDGEYCEESWQRLKGRTIMSGETLVEMLDEAVCCRVCHPGVTFLENVNCKSQVIKKFVVTQLLAFVTGRSLLVLELSTRRILRGFNVLYFRIYFRLSGPASLTSLTFPFFLVDHGLWHCTAGVKL